MTDKPHPILPIIKIRDILEHPFKDNGLSPAEIEVLEWAVQGKANHLIATEVQKAVGTVNILMFRGLGKLGISKSELGWWVLQKIEEALK